MRQALINENADLVADNPRYVMRITGLRLASILNHKSIPRESLPSQRETPFTQNVIRAPRYEASMP
jgi:hypothetical protein